jgi:hypothetical protein
MQEYHVISLLREFGLTFSLIFKASLKNALDIITLDQLMLLALEVLVD